jgi:dephospho-CoA kinase
MSLEEKRRLADYVIENDGNLEDLERQVTEVLARIKAT